MPLNSRDLWLFLKAQDQTNRALNSFARNVKNAGDTVAMAQLQAQRAAALGAIAQARLANEVQRAAIGQDNARKAAVQHSIALRSNEIATRRAEIAQLSAQKTILNQAAAYLKANGASDAQVNSVKSMVATIGDEITRRKFLIGQLQAEVAANQNNVNSIQGGINARRQQIASADQYIVQQKKILSGIDNEIKRVEAQNRAAQEHEKHLARMAGNMQQVSQTATAMGFAMAAAGVATVIGIGDAIKTSIEYERQVRATATQIDGFSGNLEELADIGRRIAREIAVPFEQIQPALFDIFSSMEVNVKDAEKLLQSFSRAAVAGQTDIQDVSRATIGLLNAFQRPASDVNKLLDLQFELVQEGVGTYEEWNQRIGLVTPSAVRAGQSIEIMVAALAASTRMGMSAARSGTAVARAFDALSNPKTVKNLKDLGVNVQDAQGKFRPFNEVLRDFRDVLNKLPEKDRLSTLLNVFQGAGGTIEARRFLQNILLGKGNLELFDDILKDTENSAGAMEKAYTLMADSAAAQTQKLKNQWMLLKEGVGKALTPAFTAVIAYIANLIAKFNALGPHAKKMFAYFAALAAIFATVMGPLLILIGMIAAIAAAFAVAGTAIAIVVGILAGFVIIAAGVSAIFVLLYKKSESFRNIMSEVGKNARLAFDLIKSGAEQVAQGFKENLQGPLSNLWKIINEKVLPAFLEFYRMWTSTLLPKLREATRIIVDLAEGAFKRAGSIITGVVIPAIEKMVGWWNRNKEQIKPFLEIMAQVIKWFLIIVAVITGVLVIALVGVLAGAIALVIGVFAALALAGFYAWKGLKWLWSQIKTFGEWIGGVFVDMWNSSVDRVKNAWNGVTEFFSGIWSGIKDVFNAGLALISEAWNTFSGWFAGLWAKFWSSDIGQLFISVFNLLAATANLGWAVLQYIFQYSLQYISDVWNYAWTNISGFFTTLWASLTAYASSIWHGWQAIWYAIWPPVKDFFVTIWNGIVSFAKGLWSRLVSDATQTFNNMKSILGLIWGGIVAAAKSAWESFYNNVISPVKRAYDTVVNKIKELQNFFDGAASWLYDAGARIVEGLIRGISSRIDALAGKMNELAQKVKDHLPGSPVKTGPLRVLNHGYAGGQIVSMIAEGMQKRMDQLRISSGMLAQGVASGFGANLAQSPSTYGGDRVVNQTVNVYTQEIDPRRNSAELGFELVKVL